MSFLLDTNVISELRKGQGTDPNVVEWFSGVAEEEIHLSVVKHLLMKHSLNSLLQSTLQSRSMIQTTLILEYVMVEILLMTLLNLQVL